MFGLVSQKLLLGYLSLPENTGPVIRDFVLRGLLDIERAPDRQRGADRDDSFQFLSFPLSSHTPPHLPSQSTPAPF